LGWWPSPTLVLLVLGALVAGRVSYRWRDGLLLLILSSLTQFPRAALT
jgi:hypothetical protein